MSDHAPQPTVAAAPATHRAVAIGTPETLPAAIAAVRLTPESPLITGCVAISGDAPAAIAGVPVLAGLDALAHLDVRSDASIALISLPAGSPQHAEAVAAAEAAGFRIVDLPPVADALATLTRREVSPPTPLGPIGQQPLDLAELVGRPGRPIDEARLAGLIGGQRVLITGAGGSIGSEIARLCARFSPDQIVLMERAENALFEIDRVLRERHPGVARAAILHDVTEEGRTLDLLMDLCPDVVFHAAAHKHVPLMEDHPAHAVVNNLFGTRSITDAAVACGASRFVMISSDKAVNPTSVMGATKRLAEMYVQSRNRDPGVRTRCTMVRFGNVLGSACSVLPIWAAQLADGRPMTVTDARMTRYFMTIPEAASLVAQSATIDDEHSEVFVLDMGEPVRILDLAQRFARASGLDPIVRTPDEPPAPRAGAAEVVLTGARPGEKLFEELAYESEQLRPTPLAGVMAWSGVDPPADIDAVLRDLADAAAAGDRETVIAAIRRHVPEMQPAAAASAQATPAHAA